MTINYINLVSSIYLIISSVTRIHYSSHLILSNRLIPQHLDQYSFLHLILFFVLFFRYLYFHSICHDALYILCLVFLCIFLIKFHVCANLLFISSFESPFRLIVNPKYFNFFVPFFRHHHQFIH